VEEAGTPAECEKPIGNDGGYLWLNTYWRAAGAAASTSNVSRVLTRGIPPVLAGWLVRSSRAFLVRR
jgi:hypothetical protein